MGNAAAAAVLCCWSSFSQVLIRPSYVSAQRHPNQTIIQLPLRDFHVCRARGCRHPASTCVLQIKTFGTSTDVVLLLADLHYV
ncbi:hypothetical protein ACQKWADRAFT_128451 [Trichoderma austrokoningii]